MTRDVPASDTFYVAPHEDAARAEQGLDFPAVLQATRAISGEIVFDRLLETLMRILLASAGASKGCLLLLEKGNLCPAAQGEVQGDALVIERPAALQPLDPATLPASILNYVRRAREHVLLRAASEPNPFSSDRYFAVGSAKSVLCLPILFKAELSAVLYLENSYVSDAFTAHRLAALELLAAQAAVSLENARLFAERERAEQRFSTAFHANPNPMTIHRMSDGAFVDINDAGLRMLGYTRDEVIGRNAVDLGMIDPASRDGTRQVLLTSGSMRNVELELRTKSGRTCTVISSAGVIELAGEQCFLSSSSDITDRKLVEEQLRQAQKLEALGRLAGGVAHDFNNLLTVINGYGLMATEQLDPSDEVYGLLCEILKAGERASGLTHQLLAYSRKQVLEARLWELNVIISGIAPMLRRLIGEDVLLVVKPGRELGLAKVDRGQVEQVILNLVLNARDAMPLGGKLVLETSSVTLDASYVATHLEASVGRHLLLSVSDTGTGMSPEIASRVFEPFFTTKEQGKGTGLGLAVVYGIVKQSGGSISVHTELQRGTTFNIYFPEAARSDAESEEPDTLRNVDYSGDETILLVEDDPQVRKFATRALGALGYTVFQAANGVEALELLRKTAMPIQLLITDVIMPAVGGPALAKELAALDPTTRVLYISGHVEHNLSGAGIAGDCGFLQKPFGAFDLAKKVREILNEAPSTLRD